MEKECSKCKNLKSVDFFSKNKKKADGLQTLCKQCMKEKSQAYYQKNKDRLKQQINQKKFERVKRHKEKLFGLLTNKFCVDCNESDPIVLDFDHVKDQKISSVTKLVEDGYSWKRILEEIKKCEVRCANCHRRKTAKEFKTYRFLMSERV